MLLVTLARNGSQNLDYSSGAFSQRRHDSCSLVKSVKRCSQLVFYKSIRFLRILSIRFSSFRFIKRTDLFLFALYNYLDTIFDASDSPYIYSLESFFSFFLILFCIFLYSLSFARVFLLFFSLRLLPSSLFFHSYPSLFKFFSQAIETTINKIKNVYIYIHIIKILFYQFKINKQPHRFYVHCKNHNREAIERYRTVIISIEKTYCSNNSS